MADYEEVESRQFTGIDGPLTGRYTPEGQEVAPRQFTDASGHLTAGYTTAGPKVYPRRFAGFGCG